MLVVHPQWTYPNWPLPAVDGDFGRQWFLKKGVKKCPRMPHRIDLSKVFFKGGTCYIAMKKIRRRMISKFCFCFSVQLSISLGGQLTENWVVNEMWQKIVNGSYRGAVLVVFWEFSMFSNRLKRWRIREKCIWQRYHSLSYIYRSPASSLIQEHFWQSTWDLPVWDPLDLWNVPNFFWLGLQTMIPSHHFKVTPWIRNARGGQEVRQKETPPKMQHPAPQNHDFWLTFHADGILLVMR